MNHLKIALSHAAYNSRPGHNRFWLSARVYCYTEQQQYNPMNRYLRTPNAVLSALPAILYMDRISGILCPGYPTLDSFHALLWISFVTWLITLRLYRLNLISVLLGMRSNKSGVFWTSRYELVQVPGPQSQSVEYKGILHLVTYWVWVSSILVNKGHLQQDNLI